jgi:hypothetical protein
MKESEPQSTPRMMQRMRILVQQKESGFYFKDVGAWVRDNSEAMDFVSSTAALEFCAANKLPGVQLVLKFHDQKVDIVLPVQAPVKAAANRISKSV